MNTKLFKLITAGAIAALLSSCGDTVVEDDYGNPVQPNAAINVLVRDASTGLELDGATVTLSTGATALTKAGFVSFKDIPAGGYSVLISKTGFASAVYPVVIIVDESNGNITSGVFIAGQKSPLVNLYPLDASLDGYVYYEDTDGTSKAAVGAEVRITIDPNDDEHLVNKIYGPDTVDANGKYSFSGLPAVGSNYKIEALDWNGKYSTVALSKKDLVSKSIVHVSSATNPDKYTIDGNLIASPFILKNNKTLIDSKSALPLEFSDAIDATKFALNKDKIVFVLNGHLSTGSCSYNNTNVVATEKTLSGSTITLKPVSTEIDVTTGLPKAAEWKPPFTVCVVSLDAVSGKTLKTSINTNIANSNYIVVKDKALPFELLNYNDVISKDADVITFEFSQAIDALKFNPAEHVKLSPATNVADKIVDGNKLKVVLINKFDDITLSSITLNNLPAANGQTIYKADIPIKKLTSDLTNQQVAGLKLNTSVPYTLPDWNDNIVHLMWNKLLGADGYRVYAKLDSGEQKGQYIDVTPNNFSAVTSAEGISYITANVSINGGQTYPYPLENKGTVSFVVQAFNSTSETSVKNAISGSVDALGNPVIYALPVKDSRASIEKAVRANTTDDSTALVIDVRSYLAVQAANPNLFGTGAIYIEFNEIMDTTVVSITGSAFVQEGGATVGVDAFTAKLNVGFEKWETDYVSKKSKLFLTMSTNPNAEFDLNTYPDPSKQTIRYQIAGIKDLAGNPATILINKGTVTERTRPLYIRFK